jgi:Na+-driven multidrug efflux pump
MFSQSALRQLIIPLILEQLLAMTVGFAATVMITRVGESAVSGVSLVDSLNNLIISILSALCTGGAVVCAQYLGRRDRDQARNGARQLFYISLIFSLALGVTLRISPRFWIHLIFGSVDAAVRRAPLRISFFQRCPIRFLRCIIPAQRCSAPWQLTHFPFCILYHERCQCCRKRIVDLYF